MIKRKVRILNILIDSLTTEELLQRLTSGIFITPNVDHLVNLQKDNYFYQGYKNASWVVCDSRIVALAARFLNTPLKEVIPGSSFFQQYYMYNGSNLGVRIFLLGAAEGVAKIAMDRINERVGRPIIIGAHSPSFGFENNTQESEDIISMINNSDSTVLVVGVGSPKQEKWIFENYLKFDKIKLFMALGATIDFEAGTLRRAPVFIQNLGLEWLFRLCNEPKRLWRRYLIKDMAFFYYVFLQKVGLYKNPFK